MIPQANPRLLGIRERNAAARAVGWAARSAPVVAASVVGTGVAMGRILGLFTQRREHQDRHTPKAEEVHSGDHHEHEL